MIQILDLNGQSISEIVMPFLEFPVTNFCGKISFLHRKIVVGELSSHNLFQRMVFHGNGTMDGDLCSGDIQRGKKWESVDMVPMGVGKKYISFKPGFKGTTCHQMVPQFPYS